MTDPRKQVSLSVPSPAAKGPFLDLKKGHFLPFFQPVVTLRTGQLAGFEVLARWQHPTDGLILPNTLIAIAERDGWIDALTQQILKKAFAAASVLPDSLTLAVNISPVQLSDLRLPGNIRLMAKKAGFAPSRLIVEITESALIDNPLSAGVIAAELKAMGCKLALDDFGTGYSSLHHLQSLPFDELKIDRGFVGSMIQKRESRKIVSAVVGLGQSLGLATVAEGIETQEQSEMMLLLGCEFGQGYFYGRPIPASELAASVSLPRHMSVTNNLSTWNNFSRAHLDVSPSQRLAQLQAVYDGAPVGLAFVDQKLRYVNLNKKLADMNGASVERHLGSYVSDMVPELFPYVEPYLLRSLNGDTITDVEAKVPRTGETRLVSYQPAFDEAREVVGVVIAVTDITDRKRTEDALKVSEAHYRSMVDLNPQVLWIMDPQGRNLDASPRWNKVTGLMKLQTPEHDWLRSVHPSDLQATVRAIADFRQSGSPIDVEYRAKTSEGSWGWKRSRGQPRFNNDGNIVCWYGSVQDTEGPSQAQGQLPTPLWRAINVESSDSTASSSEESVERKRRLALFDWEILDTPAEAEFDDLVALASEICAAPISLVSLVDSHRQWFKASIGMSASETPLSSSFCTHAVEQHGLFVVEDAAKDDRFKHNPMVLGAPHIRFYAGMPIYAGLNVAVGTLCVIDTVPRALSPGQAKALAILSQQVQARMELRSERRKLLRALLEKEDLAQQLESSDKMLREANERLEQLAPTDALTGLLNRSAFKEITEIEFADNQRRTRTVSCLVIDIDNFKKRNDEFGHAAGDDALRHVGEVLQKVIRTRDRAARIGGKEFAIILPETTSNQGYVIAKRIQELLGSGVAHFPRITLSIGIATSEASTQKWESLLSRAAVAMYAAKRRGKNRCVVYTSPNTA